MGSAVDEYLERLPAEQRAALQRLRETITAIVPGVEEVIRTGVPAFRYKGKSLVSIGAAKRHVALYIMYGSVLKTHEGELGGFDTSNTVIRFMPDTPLPDRLLVKLLRARLSEIEGVSHEPRSLRATKA